ncbi:hypothetical protein P154DRAFT_58642 [Amniculicola lignicola CBS 123094]|uniref:Mid2 domain-containing protein n=1 Tax=Amniculicola lignicola CBS 123094 TaxID=1392246 RepID=A0A6A5VXT9_9PLEO|nr:hypothetical protein P154DRAFT_58642 [Amniculicola lignicola CBS 123094]
MKLCHHPENCGDSKKCPKSSSWKPEVEKLPPKVTCSDLNYESEYKAFDAPGTLSNLMNIPDDGPGLTSYYSAHPTGKSTPVSTSASATSASVSSSISSSLTTTGSETAPPTSTSPPPPSQSKKQKVGMAVGIGAGIPIGIALIGTVIFMFVRRRHRLPEQPSAEHDEPEKYGYTGGLNSPPTPGPDGVFKAELSGESRPVFEMIASPRRSELLSSEMDQNSLKSPFVSPLESEFSGIRRSAVSDIHGDGIYELPS